MTDDFLFQFKSLFEILYLSRQKAIEIMKVTIFKRMVQEICLKCKQLHHALNHDERMVELLTVRDVLLADKVSREETLS